MILNRTCPGTLKKKKKHRTWLGVERCGERRLARGAEPPTLRRHARASDHRRASAVHVNRRPPTVPARPNALVRVGRCRRERAPPARRAAARARWRDGLLPVGREGRAARRDRRLGKRQVHSADHPRRARARGRGGAEPRRRGVRRGDGRARGFRAAARYPLQHAQRPRDASTRRAAPWDRAGKTVRTCGRAPDAASSRRCGADARRCPR